MKHYKHGFSFVKKAKAPSFPLKMASQQFRGPCELVYEYGNAEEIANMLTSRFAKGWDLDRIVKHHLPITQNGKPRLVIYYFKLVRPQFNN